MKKTFLYIALMVSVLTACSEQDAPLVPPVDGNTDVQLPADVASGELLIKFKPEMTDILDKALTRAAKSGGVMTRSGIPSTDEVLEILGGYHFERVFPVDPRNEERTRAAGMHLWYKVKFDENADLQQAANNLNKLGEISKVQGNSRIKRAYSTDRHRTYVSHAATRAQAVKGKASGKFNDPGYYRQWHYNNTGKNDFDNRNILHNVSKAGCDVGVEAAWEQCTGDPSIIVAVLDEGVMYTHPDLASNMWTNEGEELYAAKDGDGNGYKDDKYGYNFVTNSAIISWMDANDTGHGTHVAGTIAAVNNNGEGVCGIAGGSGNGDGVRIMTCQVFSGMNGVTLDGEAKAIKYAADNGAVILQCSWGYNSGEASMIEGYNPGPASQKEWETLYPLEKEALDYFIHNAGSPNGVIEGGLAIFAAGNEYAAMPAYPGAYAPCVTVSAVAADFTPASYSDYGVETDISAPGGDAEYYGALGVDDVYFLSNNAQLADESIISSGSILSTCVENGQPSYAYMDGTSMACPHVSGVAALGLSYAARQRRHFKAEEFISLLKESVETLDDKYRNGISVVVDGKTEVRKVKSYYRNHPSFAGSATKKSLSEYIGKMGTGVLRADLLLANLDGKGADMKVPNVYVAEGNAVSIDLAPYFAGGESLVYTCTVENSAIASASVENTLLKVEGIAVGITRITVNAGGKEQTAMVTVRKNANDNGWM